MASIGRGRVLSAANTATFAFPYISPKCHVAVSGKFVFYKFFFQFPKNASSFKHRETNFGPAISIAFNLFISSDFDPKIDDTLRVEANSEGRPDENCNEFPETARSSVFQK